MSLPGKLCIGILEEDNPLKSYFRFKPLLVEEEGKYVPFESGQLYPEEGCIRIVPDKNESSHFKARMRRIGLFSVVDLSAHPNENDKIRPNKNYQGDSGEQNAFIIYSDVVREPAPGMIFQILSLNPDEDIPEIIPFIPGTPKLLIRNAEGIMDGCWSWEPVSEEGAENQARLIKSEESCPVSQMQIFDIPGFRDEKLSFAILPPAVIGQVSDIPAEKTAASAPTAEPSPAPAPVPAAEPEKPWISHDASIMPKPIDPHLSPMQQMLAAQVGLNPRRGRSLQELIEEKWQHSRINQLGHSVAVVTGSPVSSPVETAVEAVRAAWKNPDMRQALLESLGGIDEFGISMQECREIIRKSTIEQQMNELEAKRLELIGEMEHLRQGRDSLKAQLKQEIRLDEAAAFADAVQKTEAAKARQAQFEKQAEEAQAAAKSAQDVLDALANGKLEKRLQEFAMNSHILEQLEKAKQLPKAPEKSLPLEKIDLETLVQRVSDRFAAEGWIRDQKFIVNLCVCAVLSPMLMLSGAAGSGKTRAAQLLSDALGWTGAGRYAAFGPGESPLAEEEGIAALSANPGDPAMILLDDVNLHDAADPLRGLSLLMHHPEWRMCLTLQDAGAGNAIPANLFDRGFTIRLSRPSSADPWQPEQKTTIEPFAPASLRSIRESAVAMVPDNVAPATAERMSALRRKLGEYGVALSRRTLDDTWHYCGLMTALLKDEISQAEIFDLAVSQRVLPALLATAPLDLLARLPEILKDMPACQAFLNQPLPIQI